MILTKYLLLWYQLHERQVQIGKDNPEKKRTDKESRTDIIVKKDIDNLVKTTQWTNRLIQHAFIYTTTNCISNWQCLLLLRSS